MHLDTSTLAVSIFRPPRSLRTQASKIITLEKAESGVTLRVGETFDLDLEGAWKIRIGDATTLRFMGASKKTAQGAFQACASGRTKLYATSDPSCRQTSPPGMQPTLYLEIPIHILP